MILVNRTSVDTVDTKQLKLVLAVKRNEVIVKQTFLRHLVFV